MATKKAKRSASEIARMMMGDAAPASAAPSQPAPKPRSAKPPMPSAKPAPAVPPSDRLGALLDELLAIWRETPGRALGDAIVELGAAAKTPAEWSGDLPPSTAITTLLDSLLAKGSVQARERLEAMATWPTDPRIDRWVAERYVDIPFTSTGARPFWTRMVPLGSRITDPAASDRLVDARGKVGDGHWIAQYLDRIRAAIGEIVDVAPSAAVATKLDDAGRLLAARADASRPKHAEVSAELLAAVLAKPDDDHARVVLGDALQEAGDPRGELIAIQMAATCRELTPAEKKREKQLVSEHRSTLLGPLDDALKEVTFARGFLSRCVVRRATSGAIEAAIAKVVGHPLWATVEHVDGGSRELVEHDVMRSLRSVSHTHASIEWLARHPRLEAFTGNFVRNSWAPVLADASAFPALRELEVRAYTEANAILDAPVAKRLLALEIQTTVQRWGNSGEAYALLERVASLRLPKATLVLWRYEDKDWGCGFRFVRDGDDLIVRVFATNMPANWESQSWPDCERGLAIVAAMQPARVEIEKNYRAQPYAKWLPERVAALTS